VTYIGHGPEDAADVAIPKLQQPKDGELLGWSDEKWPHSLKDRRFKLVEEG